MEGEWNNFGFVKKGLEWAGRGEGKDSKIYNER